MKQLSKILLSLFLTFGLQTFYTQISNGGLPYSFQNNLPKAQIQTKQIAKPATSLLNNLPTDKGAYQIGLSTPVNINTNNAGTWTTLANGDKIWRLKIYSQDALALALHYSCFYIPNGAEIFLYNNLKNHILGKFESERNFNNPITHTQMIQGETTWLEYYAPKNVTENPIIQISNVVYIFRGVEDFVNPFIKEASGKDDDLFLKADPCQIDVACSPENVGWGEQIDAAVHYTFQQGAGYYVCSASLLNNTSQDCTPYILTAWHCGEKDANSSLSGWTWYWNYQKSSCQPNSNGSDPSKGNQTMINGTVRSSSGSGIFSPSTNQVAGSDYYLVELGSNVPASYNAFFAGWNAGSSAASSGVSVHHPAGSAKKISTYTSNLSSTSYNGGANNAHWRVYWSATTNGHGVTEGGSSGSPIFDQNGRVVGQLSGGSSYCTATGSPDLYGKFSTNWNGNGTGSTAQLQPWLDPTNTGATILDGAYEPCNQNNPPTCSINVSTTSITAGGTVNFSDASSGTPNSWSWNFDNTSLGGVNPSTSTVQNPGSVTYSNPGTYVVELTAGNANGNCTTTINITVTNPGSTSGCDTLLNISAADTLRLYSTNNGGFISGWNGYGDLSKAEAYSNYTPYNSITGMELFLYSVNDGGNGATVDFNVWDDNSGQPGSIIATTQVSLASIASSTSGNGIYTVNFPSSVTINGNTIYCGITMNGFASYPGGQDSLGIITNSVFDLTPNSGWEQWDDGTWYDMQTAWGGTYSFSHYIRPILCGGCSSGLAINPSTTNASCGSNNGQILITATGGTGPYQYSIDGGNTYQSTGTFSNLSPGTYDILVDDNGGCSETSTITLTNLGGVTASISSSQSICAGNSASISAAGAGTGGTYQWDNGLGGGSSHVVSPTTTTTYNVVVSDANGCTDNASVIIIVNSAPTVTLNPSTATICAGESVTISASGAQTYSWNTGSSGSSITVNPTNQTTYSVVGQNGTCAGNPVTSTISVSAAPTVNASANVTTILVGGTVTFSSAGSGATSYSWDFGDGNSSTQTNPSHTYASSGIYTVTLTGTLNGCINTSQLTINVGAVNIEDVNLENSISVTPNPNNGNFEILIDLNEFQELNLEIHNSIGQLIIVEDLNKIKSTRINYNLTDFPSGFYYLSITSNSGKTTKRLFISE